MLISQLAPDNYSDTQGLYAVIKVDRWSRSCYGYQFCEEDDAFTALIGHTFKQLPHRTHCDSSITG